MADEGLVQHLAAWGRITLAISARLVMRDDLTFLKFRTLVALNRQPLRTDKLAELVGIPPATITEAADSLVSSGLIEWVPDERSPDERLLVVTEAGRAVITEVVEARTAEIRRLVDESGVQLQDPAADVLRGLVLAAGSTEAFWWGFWTD
jgi:DNA-binding MarR family transcriptional regulator